MDKIKITLTSGSVIEKPLVSAFKASTGSYIVLDNEVNGTMGLPIILVAKYNENRLVKIMDQNEWNGVKEILRNIISGNQVDYIKIPLEVMADDGFFSQLTLPIASFDSLKANYKPIEEGAAAVSTPIAPEMPEIPNVMEPASTPNPVPAPQPSEPTIEPSPIPQVIPDSIPASSPTPVAPPVMPEPPRPTEVVSPMPVVEPIPEQVETPNTMVDFSAEKDAFMKACENMFDALVAKFNK